MNYSTMLLRSHILALLCIATAPFAFAQSANESATAEPDPVVELMLETWTLTPEAVTTMVERLDGSVTMAAAISRSFDNHATHIHWGACEAITQQKSCAPSGRAFMADVKKALFAPDFILSLSEEQHTALAQAAVEAVSIKQAREHLTTVERLYTEPFDVSQGLGYHRWRTNQCNFIVAGRSFDRRLDAPSKAECLEDPFAEFLLDRYCPDHSGGAETCDLSRISWLYGFLTRRHTMAGAEGDAIVAAWQQLLREAALAAEVDLTPTNAPE